MNTNAAMPNNDPSITDLIVDGLGDGGFTTKHAFAMALANASPLLESACEQAVEFLQLLPESAERNNLLSKLQDALDAALPQ